MKKVNMIKEFLINNYSIDEIKSMKVRDAKKISKKKGFAIGTILIAIALIAAVGAAIAVASKSTSKSSTEPQAKLYASNVINQGSTIKQTVDMITINNGISSVYNNIVFNPYANGLENGEGGNLTSGGLGKYGLFNPKIGTNFVQLDNKTFASGLAPTIRLDSASKGIALTQDSPFGVGTFGFVPANGYNNWFIGTMDSNAGTGGGTADEAIFLTGIKEDICLEINKTVNGTTGMSITTIPEVVSTAGNPNIPWNAGNITNIASVVSTGGNSANVEGWTEGCFRDTTNNSYVYFNILKVN